MPLTNLKSERSNHSKNLDAMISRPPSRLLLWGSTIILLFILFLIAFSRRIKFPVTIHRQFRVIYSDQERLTGYFLDTTQVINGIQNGQHVLLTFSQNFGRTVNVNGILQFADDDRYKIGHSNRLNVIINNNDTIKNFRSGSIVDAQITINELSLYEQVEGQFLKN